MKLKETRAAKMAAAQAIVDAAEGGVLTDEKSAELDGIVAEVEQLDAQIARAEKDAGLLNQVKSLGAKGGVSESRPDGGAAAKTLGEHFVKSLGDNFRDRLDAGAKVFKAPEFIPAKARTDVQSTPTGQFADDQLVDVDTSIQRAKRDRLVIADLLGKGTMSGTSIRYYLEGGFEGDFATVAEGGLKPQVHIEEPTPVTDELRKIAAWIGFTDEILEDLPLWASEINQRLLYKLAVFEEQQLLRGDGTGNNLTGILNRTGVQAELSEAYEDNADALFRAMTKISTATDYEADALVIHPLDYQDFRLHRDGNDQYVGGGFFQGQYGNGGIMVQPPIWGLRTVVTPVIERRKPLVGNFQQAATMYRKGGVRVESTISDQDDFIHNRVKTRAEERIALAVRNPEAFCEVELVGKAPVGGGSGSGD
ncbi:major capsid protein [Gordonia phage Schmidt]|uniref:Major capsid protein n=1 Tax=Gordonia phage Schmidt TaxID=2301697 RepID=A0A385E049_9CAUD|nr:major capsid protein [Gordonia phage Schmidt]AXQ65130.1 major capsid protein [Gordonia phage Schmidt]